MSTTNTDFLPNETGLDLGNPDQRWTGFFDNLSVTGTINGTIVPVELTADTTNSFSTNQTLAFSTAVNALIMATSGGGGITLTLPSATGLEGRTFRIKKVDAGVGFVTIVGAIDGMANYPLTNQYQYVVLESGNGTWQIVGNN